MVPPPIPMGPPSIPPPKGAAVQEADYAFEDDGIPRFADDSAEDFQQQPMDEADQAETEWEEESLLGEEPPEAQSLETGEGLPPEAKPPEAGEGLPPEGLLPETGKGLPPEGLLPETALTPGTIPESEEEAEAELEEIDEKQDQKEEEKRHRDLRQELKDYLKGVRKKLETVPGSPEGSKTAAAGASETSRPEAETPAPRTPGRLFGYLQELTGYLPEDEKSIFHHSDIHFKMEFLKTKLGGRKGIRKQIETQYQPRKAKAVRQISRKKLANAFSYMKGLASFLPDRNIGDIMQSKISGILRRLAP